MPLIDFRALAGDGQTERWALEAIPWVHEAGNPYYDWFFGGRARTLAVLCDWLRRSTSEVFVGRGVLLVEGDRQTGGFIALGGDELRQCRGADALAAMETAGRAGRAALMTRLRQSQALFGPVPADAFYLSKLGVAASARGAGRGRWLLEAYLAAGTNLGFRRFCLDVCADNAPAVRLYRAAGFRVGRTGHSDEATMTYLRMSLELEQAGDVAPRARGDGTHAPLESGQPGGGRP